MGGGGGRLKLVSDALSRSHEWLINNLVYTPGIQRMSLPALRTLSNLDTPEEMTGRLDVAYGLSFDSLDIGEIFPPHRILDVPPMSPWKKSIR